MGSGAHSPHLWALRVSAPRARALLPAPGSSLHSGLDSARSEHSSSQRAASPEGPLAFLGRPQQLCASCPLPPAYLAARGEGGAAQEPEPRLQHPAVGRQGWSCSPLPHH